MSSMRKNSNIIWIWVVILLALVLINSNRTVFAQSGETVAVKGNSTGFFATLRGFPRRLKDFLLSNIEEHCEFKCPFGQLAMPRHRHEPSINGCGSHGFEGFVRSGAFRGCCNEHDICYEICGADKEDCDREFKRCIYNTCDEVTTRSSSELAIVSCKTRAKLFYSITAAVGCKAYLDAQKVACSC